MNLEQFKKRAKKIPDTPGVYFFLGKRKELLYIGKATSLRDRVRSYFNPDLMEARGPLLVQMVEKTASIDWRQTDSVLEALLLEGSLIHSHRPKFNTDSKDDKSYNYVVITKEDFPRVLKVRSRELAGEKQYKKVFGPFPHGLQLNEALKLVRKIFPYRDTCIPQSGKRCFNAQIGLCPGVCSGEMSKQEYAHTIRHISLLFEGKKKQLLQELKRVMKTAAKEERFEDAKEYRRQLFGLEHIQDVSLIKDEYRTSAAVNRIEAYDIAHLAGEANVGVMVVVEGGIANKNEYRKFKIKDTKANDVGALREVLSRRLAHTEWQMPRVIVVDGSKAQINSAQKVLDEVGVVIPIVSVVKDEKHRPRNILGNAGVIKGKERDILLANAEAHRFAIQYHRKKLRKNMAY